MKVYLKPTGLHSQAMLRVVSALERYAPDTVQVVENPRDADVQVMHVIDFPEKPDDQPLAPEYVVVQYCGFLLRGDPRWQPFWQNASMVWSYYPLHDALPERVPFFFSPLGLGPVFHKISEQTIRDPKREFAIFTSGYSTGPQQEAIEEAQMAAEKGGQRAFHLGPPDIEGMTRYPKEWNHQLGINDQTLAQIYLRSERVSGLRHLEGFEMPCLEGLALGARPVVFDRVDMKTWYDGIAEFVPECHGDELVDRLHNLFMTPPSPVSQRERLAVRQAFDWQVIASAFWQMLLNSRTPRVAVSGTKRRLLWVGDAVAATGFARATHKITDVLEKNFEVHILGINYNGDPELPWNHNVSRDRIYPCTPGGDAFGVRRIGTMVQMLGPAVIVIQQDPWNFQDYLQEIGNVPVIGAVAVDGKNCKGWALNGLAHAVFWTKFGEDEAKLGGYTGPSRVIPLGVDLDLYKPLDKVEIRERFKLPQILADRGMPADAFIVGVVGRNQQRKRLDLTIRYFANWIHSRKIRDAGLWLHCAPTGDDAYDLKDLSKYYKVADRVFVPTIPRFAGLKEEAMSRTYNIFDCLFTTTLGEGFGFPMFEAMACGVPLVVPRWSALEELCENAAMQVACTGTSVHPPKQINTIGGVMDEKMAIEALDAMYRSRETRNLCRERGLALVAQDRYRWRDIGQKWTDAVEYALYQPETVLPQEAWQTETAQ